MLRLSNQSLSSCGTTNCGGAAGAGRIRAVVWQRVRLVLELPPPLCQVHQSDDTLLQNRGHQLSSGGLTKGRVIRGRGIKVGCLVCGAA